MYSTGNQRKQKEGSSLGYSIWPFSPLEEAKRGGTAPGFPERNFYYQKKLPVSSHKFEVNSMNSPSHPKSNKVSIRGSGWNSSISRAPVKLITIMQENPKISALKPTEDFKRPVTIGYRASEITKINEMARHRPPSRHKTPPKATGLYLPPSSCTPPNELATKEMFEKTWSYKHPTEQPENSELQYSDRKNAGSPAFEHAWDEGITRPKTQNEKTRRMRIIASQEKVQPPMGNDIIKKPFTDKLYDVPIILNRDEKYNRRIFSAHIIEAKSGKQRPPSYKAVKAAFQSSLDGDFLNLFEPTA